MGTIYGALGLHIGFLAGFLLAIWVVDDNPTVTQVGKTRYEIDQQIQECEKDLPRSKSCEVVLTTQIKEKVND